jgi:hypothetical protein
MQVSPATSVLLAAMLARSLSLPVAAQTIVPFCKIMDVAEEASRHGGLDGHVSSGSECPDLQLRQPDPQL